MGGYIKLHRQITEWEWYQDANAFRVFIHLLLNANHADSMWKGMLIKRGQRFTSIATLSKELGISQKASRRAIEKLILSKNVASEGASNGTMITICNYDTYQANQQAEGQTDGQTKGEQKPKKGRANGQQTRNKEEEKEEKEIIDNIIFQISDMFDKKYINESAMTTFGKLLKNYSSEQILQSIRNAKNDLFWTNQFLSPNKLDKNDKDGVKYIDRFLALKTNNYTAKKGNIIDDVKNTQSSLNF